MFGQPSAIDQMPAPVTSGDAAKPSGLNHFRAEVRTGLLLALVLPLGQHIRQGCLPLRSLRQDGINHKS